MREKIIRYYLVTIYVLATRKKLFLIVDDSVSRGVKIQVRETNQTKKY